MLAALRAATTERHELLHRIMPLSVDSVAIGDYVAHLTILRAWLGPLEAWLATFGDGPQLPGNAPRIERLPLIETDLALAGAAGVSRASGSVHREASGMTPPDAASGASGASSDWHGAQSAAYRWGVCYVIEGSQLGGAVLYARLKERLAPHPLRYLAAGRESLGPRWQTFLRAMAAEVHAAALIDEACRGAADAFDRLIALAQRPVPACTSAD